MSAGHLETFFYPFFGYRAISFYHEHSQQENLAFVQFPGQFYAHTHKDDFRLQILNTEDEKTSTKSFVLQTASVSPIYSNNPAFKVFTMRTDIQALVDYDQHYLDLEVATGM